jgi:Matrixin
MTWRVRALTILAAIGAVLPRDLGAYATTGTVWNIRTVPYSINTTNLDLPESAVEPAVRVGADVWTTQSGAAITLVYSGRSAQTTTGNDGLNLVVFRNASSGSAIATTYWWSSGGRIIDADIVFWDAAFRFFSGSSGCSGGFYIEDIAAHEFGHALGLGHSAITGATMYPSVSSCNAGNRTLETDDIDGVRFLYPATVPRPVQNLRVVPAG